MELINNEATDSLYNEHYSRSWTTCPGIPSKSRYDVHMLSNVLDHTFALVVLAVLLCIPGNPEL